jgi:hypothetical protein
MRDFSPGKQRRLQFLGHFEELAENHEDRHGRPATPDELNGFADVAKAAAIRSLPFTDDERAIIDGGGGDAADAAGGGGGDETLMGGTGVDMMTTGAAGQELRYPMPPPNNAIEYQIPPANKSDAGPLGEANGPPQPDVPQEAPQTGGQPGERLDGQQVNPQPPNPQPPNAQPPNPQPSDAQPSNAQQANAPRLSRRQAANEDLGTLRAQAADPTQFVTDLTTARAKNEQEADRRATDAARLLNESDPAAAQRFAKQYTKATGKEINLSLPPFVARVARTDRTNRFVSDEEANLTGTATPLANPEIRNDSGGRGGYLENRDGGRRDHLGIDLKAVSGAAVTSPVSGVLRSNYDPYGGDRTKSGKLNAVRIETDDGKFVDLMYVKRADGLADGQRVTAGETSLGTAQDLSTVYGNSVGNHVHVQVLRSETGANGGTREIYYDPEPMIFGPH